MDKFALLRAALLEVKCIPLEPGGVTISNTCSIALIHPARYQAFPHLRFESPADPAEDLARNLPPDRPAAAAVAQIDDLLSFLLTLLLHPY